MSEQDEFIRVDDRRRAERQTVVIAIGLLIAWLPQYIGPVTRWVGFDSLHTGPLTQMVWNWTVTFVLVAYIVRVERRSLRSIL